MGLFKKKCQYCEIEKGILVKVPEFINEVTKAFCSSEHLELYKKYVKGTPSKSSCPYCKN